MSNKHTAGLPRLILIADQFTRAHVADRVCEAVGAGVRWVQLRDHGARDEQFREASEALVDRLRDMSGEVMISVNSRPQVARDLGLHYHRGRDKPSFLDSEDCIQGYSAHSLAEAKARTDVDYFFYSPIFPTGSKPGHPGIGLAGLQEATAQLAQPVYALGGVKPRHCAACLAAGAYGVAVISGILAAQEIEVSVQAYFKAINTKTAQ